MFCSHCKRDREIVYTNGWCRECTQAYRQANKDKVAEQNRQYYQANKDKVAEQNRQYYQANKDKVAEQKRQYYMNKNGMSDIYAVEAELGIRRMTGCCQTCGKRVTANSTYTTYCSYECYRAAFRIYTRDKR